MPRIHQGAETGSGCVSPRSRSMSDFFLPSLRPPKQLAGQPSMARTDAKLTALSQLLQSTTFSPNARNASAAHSMAASEWCMR